MSDIVNITKQTSKRRQDASRANGAKSHGPTTPEGKARSSQNAFKHGGLAKLITFSREEEERNREIYHNYALRFQPRDQLECDLVEEVVTCNAKMRLCWALEAALLDMQMSVDLESVEKEWIDATPIDRQAIAFVELSKDSSAVDRLQRYARSLSLQAQRTTKMLLSLKERRLPPTGNPPPKELKNEPSSEIEHPVNQPEQQYTDIERPSEAAVAGPGRVVGYLFRIPRPIPVRRGDKLVARFAPEPEFTYEKQETRHEKYMVCGA